MIGLSRITIVTIVALLLLVACKDDGTGPPERPELSVQSGAIEKQAEVNVPEEEKGGVAPGPGMTQLVELAKKDLAGRLGIGSEDIELISGDYVTWPDSSAGCPQPGMQYLQVLTNGSRIRLRFGKQTYHYHSGGNRPPFMCEKPSPIDPALYGPGET